MNRLAGLIDKEPEITNRLEGLLAPAKEAKPTNRLEGLLAPAPKPLQLAGGVNVLSPGVIESPDTDAPIVASPTVDPQMLSRVSSALAEPQAPEPGRDVRMGATKAGQYTPGGLAIVPPKPKTVSEKAADTDILDVISHMPGASLVGLNNIRKKMYEIAKERLEKGDYGPTRRYGMTPMGGYMTVSAPATKKELETTVQDYEKSVERGETIPAAIVGGIADLPGYMAEMSFGGIDKVKSVPAALTFAGKILPIQWGRVQDAITEQVDSGEKGYMAIAKGIGDTYIENLSETSGGAIKAVAARMPFAGKLTGALRKFAKGKYGWSDDRFWKEVSNRVGYHGLLEEWGEERVGTFLRGLVNVNDYGAGKDSTPQERILAGMANDLQVQNQLIEIGVLTAFPVAKHVMRDKEGIKAHQQAVRMFRRELGAITTSPSAPTEVTRESLTKGLSKAFGIETDQIAPGVMEKLQTPKAEVTPEKRAEAINRVKDILSKDQFKELDDDAKYDSARKMLGKYGIEATKEEIIGSEAQTTEEAATGRVVEDKTTGAVSEPSETGVAEAVGEKELERTKETPDERKYFTELLLSERQRLEKEMRDEGIEFYPEGELQRYKRRLADIDKDLRRRGYTGPRITLEKEANEWVLAKPAETNPAAPVGEKGEAATKPAAEKKPAKASEKGKALAEKQPWEMMREDFIGEGYYYRLSTTDIALKRQVNEWQRKVDALPDSEGAAKGLARALRKQKLANDHRAAVKTATEENLPVPRPVLEEYKGEKWADDALAKLAEAKPGEKKGEKPYKIGKKITVKKRYFGDPLVREWSGNEVSLRDYPDITVYQTKSGWIVGYDKGGAFGKEHSGGGWIGFDTKQKAIKAWIAKAQAEEAETTEAPTEAKPGEKKGEAKEPTVAATKAEKGKETPSEAKEQARTESEPGAEVHEREAVDLTPTGKLDPTKEEDALKIVELHRQEIRGRESAHGGVTEEIPREGGGTEEVVMYSTEEVDQAYRTVQKQVDSPLRDTNLFAMPGKESQMEAIGKKMERLAKKPTFPAKRRGVSIPRPKNLPRVAKDKGEVIKAVAIARAKESSGHALRGLYVDGDNLVATDGRRLFIAKGKWGKDGLYMSPNLKTGKLGKADTEGLKFPPYKNVIPTDYSDSDAIEIRDLDVVWRRLRKADIISSAKDMPGVLIVLNSDGTLGFAADASEVGHVEINVREGAKILGGMDPQFLMDVLAFHARRGDKQIEMWFPVPDRPILTRSPHDKTLTVTMPVNAGDASESLAETIDPAKKTQRLKAEAEAKAKKESEAAKSPVEAKKPSGGKAMGTPSRKEIAVSMEPAGKVQTAAEIIKYAERSFKIPIRGKATFRKRALGWFDPKAVGIRLKDVRSLTTMTHEVGHHIDWTLNKRMSRKPPNAEIGEELMSLGKELYGETKPTGGYKSEGFAEFMRYYLVGDEAGVKAPATMKWFKSFLKSRPEVAKPITKIKKMLTVWRMQGAEARIESQISRKKKRGSAIDVLERGSLWLETAFRDELAPIKRLMRKAGIKESELSPGENPYQIAVARADKSAAVARHFVLEYTTNMAGNRTGKGLREIIRPVAADVDVFTRWMVAARAILLHKRGINPGITRADAEYVYERYDSPQWQGILKEVTAWNDRLLDYLSEAGGLDKNARKQIRKANPVYIPFMRAFQAGELRVQSGAGKGVAQTRKAVKKIKGSGREIIDVLESMITQSQKIISIAHKTEVAVAIARLADRPGMAGMIWKVPAPTQATRFQAEQLKKDIARIAHKRFGLDPEEISSGMLEHWDEMFTVYSNASHYYGKDNIVSFVIDGKRQFYEVHPALYRAMEGLDQYHLPWFFDLIFGKPARALRLGATGVNPAFGLIRNFLRDAMTFTVLSKHAKAGPLSAVSGVVSDVARTEKAQHFKAMGGKMASQILADRKAAQHLRKEVLVSSVGGKTIYHVAHPIDALRELFGVTEAGTRIGEFNAALKYGEKKWGEGSKDAAIYALNQAQDVTTNFSRHGSIGKVLNQCIAFFNAAIQGPDKILRTIAQRPTETLLKAIAALTIPAIWLWWKYKDEEWYKNLAPHERANYMHFEVPKTDKIVRIPVPFELGHVFQSAPVAALDANYRKDPELVREMFKESVKSANPFDWPAVVSPVVDILANEDFAGKPIVSKSVEYKMPEDQYKRYTTSLMKRIGKVINYSPAKLEHLVNNYSGGVYARVARTIDLKNKKEITIHDWPVIQTLFLREPYAPKADLERFYSRREELNRMYASKKLPFALKRQRSTYDSVGKELSELWKELPDADTRLARKRIYAKMKRALRKVAKYNSRTKKK